LIGKPLEIVLGMAIYAGLPVVSEEGFIAF